MVDRAKVRGLIPYSDLVKKIKNIKLEAHDPRLFHMLGEISSEEDTAGRGMLTVVVVHKVGDMQPGPTFFDFGAFPRTLPNGRVATSSEQRMRFMEPYPPVGGSGPAVAAVEGFAVVPATLPFRVHPLRPRTQAHCCGNSCQNLSKP
jgi:hypothetical protein